MWMNVEKKNKRKTNILITEAITDTVLKKKNKWDTNLGCPHTIL
jgi:hypothetical protein